MRNKKLRLWCIVLAVAMLLVALPVTAMAADDTVIISNVAELTDAIQKQEDG